MLNDAYNPIFNMLEKDVKPPFTTKAVVIVDLSKLTAIKMSDFRDTYGNSLYDYMLNTASDLDMISTLDEDILTWLVADFSYNLFGIFGWCRLIYARDGVCTVQSIPQEIVEYVMSTISEFIETAQDRWRLPITSNHDYPIDAVMKIFVEYIHMLYTNYKDTMERVFNLRTDVTASADVSLFQEEIDSVYWFSHLESDLFFGKLYGFYYLG